MATTTQRKMATLEISGELLRQALAIPDNVEVELVFHREDDTFRLLLKGDGLPDGCEVPNETGLPRLLKPRYYRDNELDIVNQVVWEVV